jgi:hypothetical protein
MKQTRNLWIVALAVPVLVVAGALEAGDVYQWRAYRAQRTALLAAIRPVRLSNCAMKRFGDPNDGGYVLCEDLTSLARAAYSYGIDGRDEWGCDIARAYRLPIHQYDCFNAERPVCAGAQFHFHDECVGAAPARIGRRRFDSVVNQVTRNGDAGKHLLVKMDVESAEGDALPAIPDSTLEVIDQLVVEFHDSNEARTVDVIERLKKKFYIANVHFNNTTCTWYAEPLPASVFEILFVNKRLATLDTANRWAVYPNPLDGPNDPSRADCQEAW